MSKPSSRQELVNYCLRRLGYPVLEINVDDDQIDDLVDDALQYFNERHFDGVEKMYLKYQLTQEDIDRGSAVAPNGVGIVTTTGSSPFGTQNFYESSNYIQVPDSVIGIEKVFKFDTSSISGGMFSIKYQLFLNDLYYYGALDLLNYAMVKTHLEDISRIITPDVQLRFNKKQHRLYLDIDWAMVNENSYIIIDCFRIVDPSDFPKVYNDWWIKKYLTALIKRQWGQNLIKFNGVQLPGGITLNGRQIYDDAILEIEKLEEKLHNEYELPPMDMIG